MEPALEQRLAQLEEANPDALLLPGFEFAFAGYVEAINAHTRAVYDAQAIIDHLAQSRPYELALDLFYAQYHEVYTGPDGPLFLWR